MSKSRKWTPLELLRPYQERFVLDEAPFKIVSCARQCGKSTMFACEAAMDCVRTPLATWLCVSAGQRQASEWLEKAITWSQDWSEFMTNAGVPTAIVASSKTEIRFSNGSRIIALPPNPDTIRGYTANVILDEFAYHEHADKVWQAVVPSVSSNLFSKLKVCIGSTVAGKGNKFWELFEGAENNPAWSRYKITVNDAVREGCQIKVDEVKEGINDETIWNQEYLCIPVDEATVLFPYDKIEACEGDEATRDLNEILLDRPGERFVIGVDIGRKRDKTVIWVLKIGVNNKLITVGIVELRDVELQPQEKIIERYLGHKTVQKCYIDSTGIGTQLAENLKRRFGSTVVPYDFTEDSKSALFLEMQAAIQAKEIILPKGDQAIRDDFHAMQRLFTSSGRVLYRAPRNEDGHSDLATACALAIKAAKEGMGDNNGAESLLATALGGRPDGRHIGELYNPLCW